MHRIWTLLKDTVEGYIEDEAMSRGAAIAYYTVFSIAPLLVIATAIAGLFFGEVAVQGAVAEQLRGLLGNSGAEAVQAMIAGASDMTSGRIAAVIGVVTLLLTASGVFGEVQAALNEIWKAPPPPAASVGGIMARLVKARVASLGLVAATGFLLLTSLVVSAALAALGTWVGGLLPAQERLFGALNFTVSFGMVTVLFAAIYKILPDRRLRWRDVLVGAVVTAFLFTVGKTLIGWYIGGSGVATTYGAAGALMVVLLWVFYSAQVFLLGAEFTKAWAGLAGNPEAIAAGARPAENVPTRRERRRRRREARAKAGTAGAGAAEAGAGLPTSGLPLVGAAALAATVAGLLRRRR